MLAGAGAPVAGAPPCWEQVAGAPAAEDGLAGVPLDPVFLAARVGGLKMTELLAEDSGYGLGVELPIAPDLTPHFFPKRDGGGEASGGDAAAAPPPCSAAAPRPVWAWQRLRPLELAVLHRRADMAVLLARLGDLLHTVDHVAISPPDHYSVTEACFRGLTPLHLCAAAGPAHGDVHYVLGNRRNGGRPREGEPWLWRDLTPLHLAILSKSHDVAELLVETSTPDSLAVPCAFKDPPLGDVSADTERNFSPLLLAFERDFTRLHRKIARKSPTC
ncbi:unnamed protein product [Prorocentrum cordatum]|uniref:Uncharacterized protein n=1 Tax=Prorocentrum cordatum TaxID=2364126 RepID=A0ABN9URQ1_9DINO|nr:unnamed protein product [Polarella glacialis]